jgi:hypothetical protein
MSMRAHPTSTGILARFSLIFGHFRAFSLRAYEAVPHNGQGAEDTGGQCGQYDRGTRLYCDTRGNVWLSVAEQPRQKIRQKLPAVSVPVCCKSLADKRLRLVSARRPLYPGRPKSYDKTWVAGLLGPRNATACPVPPEKLLPRGRRFIVMQSIEPSHAIRKWFAGLVESSFQTQIGVCDPSLLSYLAELLTEFIHVERIHSLADGSGRRVQDVAGMLHQVGADPTGRHAERLREVHRHIGDYTLFWTGVYPENLRRLHRRRERDDLISYLEQGKRSYAIASHLSNEHSDPPGRLLETLSKEFESCVCGLGLVRKEWERYRTGGFTPIVIDPS